MEVFNPVGTQETPWSEDRNNPAEVPTKKSVPALLIPDTNTWGIPESAGVHVAPWSVDRLKPVEVPANSAPPFTAIDPI
jgi:hypothetical protein